MKKILSVVGLILISSCGFRIDGEVKLKVGLDDDVKNALATQCIEEGYVTQEQVDACVSEKIANLFERN